MHSNSNGPLLITASAVILWSSYPTYPYLRFPLWMTIQFRTIVACLDILRWIENISNYFWSGFLQNFWCYFPSPVSFVTTTSEAQAGDVSLEYKSVRGINYKRENTISALHYCSPYMNSSPRESCCIQYATQTKQVLVCVVFSLRLVKRSDNRNRAFQQNMIQTSFLIHSRMKKKIQN